jgi:excisionase family DNA binding protein
LLSFVNLYKAWKEVRILKREDTKDQARELQSPIEVARRLGMSRSNVYHLATVGSLLSIKFGKAVRFDPKDVEEYIREHRRKKGKAA